MITITVSTPELTKWVAELSYLGLFLFVFATGAGLPIPEDAALLGAGYLVHDGVCAPLPAVIVAFVAVLAGDGFLYFAGRTVARRALESRWLARLATPERLARGERQFARFGIAAVALARFVPGLRAAVYLAAGTMRMPLARFALVDGLAALVNVPLLIYLGYRAGAGIEQLGIR